LFRADAGEFASDASQGNFLRFVAQLWNRRAGFEHRRLANL
jgi:hypothetical protein